MSKTKKFILSIGVAITMLVALVIGFNIPKGGAKVDNGAPSVPNVNNDVKPSTITYQAGEIEVVGTNQGTINYTYSPSNNAKATSVKAYEYIFGRPSQVADTMAVTLQPLEEIDGVTISYYYADEPQTFDDTTTVDTAFKAQTIDTANDNIYVYVIVSPSDANLPVDVTTNIVWNFGIAGTMTYMVNGTPITETIVKGQPLPEPETPTTTQDGYYFDAWFYDENFTQLASFPVETQGQNLYARFANLPQGVTTYTTYNDGVYKISTGLDIETLVIPTYYNDGINGIGKITTISTDSFASMCSTLTSIYIPTSVTSIESGAFWFCKLLTTVNLPSGLKEIGDGAFSESAVTNINLNDCNNLLSLSNDVFKACYNLTSITLPKSLISVGDNAFYDCYSLESIDFSNCTNLTTIGNSIFEMSTALTNIDLSKCTNLTSIGDYAFVTCNALTNVILPNSLTSIGTSAFGGTAITDIDLSNTKLTTINNSFSPTTLQSIKLPSTVETIAEKAFYQYTNLTNVDFSKCSNLTTIGANAFASSELTSVDLSKCSALTTIQNSAFQQCGSLINIDLPNSVTTIGKACFYNCDKLQSIEIPSGITVVDEWVFQNCFALNNVTLPTGLISINSNAFDTCASLITINFEDLTNLETIGAYAFTNSALTSVDLSKCSALTTIQNSAFQQCGSLINIDLPNSVTTIGKACFYNCDKLQSIEIPSGITVVDEWVFQNCFALNNVTLPSSVTTISNYAFDTCTSLITINFEDLTNLEIIGEKAFNQCSSLLNIVIPSSVNKIGYSAFINCANITIGFENTSTWYVVTTEEEWNSCDTTNATVVEGLTTTASATNGTMLNTTYVEYYWFRVD